MTTPGTRRLFLSGAGAMVGAAALSACTEDTEDTVEPTTDGERSAEETAIGTWWQRRSYDEVPDGGTLHLPISQLPTVWNPHRAGGGLASLSTIREPLGRGAEIRSSETGERSLDPDFIEHAEVTSEEPFTVSFRFHAEARWEDGSPIVVDDLISQWSALRGQDEEFLVTSTVGWEQIESITETDDEFSGEIVFSRPYPAWITLLHPDVPASISGSPETWNDVDPSNPPPSKGPFAIDAVDENAGVVTLTRNENWWGRAPRLESITFTVLDSASAPRAFADGGIDLLEINDGEALSTAGERTDATIQTTASTSWTHLTMNTEGAGGALADVTVREAIARGIDREAVGRAVLEPLDAEVVLVDNFFYLPGQDGYEDSFEALALDRDQAAALLDEAGWVLEGEVRSKDGQPLELTITVPAETPSNEARARRIQADLQSLGMSVELETVPAEAYFDEHIAPRQFDLATFSWSVSQFSETASVSLFHPPDSGDNHSGFADERIEPLVEQLTGATDTDTRHRVANEISAIVAESFVCVPLYASPRITAVDETVVNIGATSVETTDWTQVGKL